MNTENENIVDKLINIYGNANRTAIALNVHRPLIDHWRKKGFIPFKWGKPIEKITNAKITALEVWENAR